MLPSASAADTTFEKRSSPRPGRRRLVDPAGSRYCGVQVEDIDDPLMQKIRYLDKLVDELAKGKPMEKVLRA